ncbi:MULTISPECIES: ABC transporter ATP-binding protein [unclassified Nocardioides]|uniref:ABC transporter ATP-binding protein n=1 Tax=unclassified Nocardioides TaxID=2615069 RepID=UPI0009F13072|nr:MULTISPECIES: ABC transporter ATP-binding protein [unclassified Nocardioides]GAW49156.1 ABC transporter related protein [Nocardioides sp. PD653-B2]GAW55644.1 ABC transporter related protein [Nocardioides sp. PD653]
MPLLEIESLGVSYGGVVAVRDISFHVDRGETVCLLGANGAGKSSTLMGISGVVAGRSGSVRFDGQEIGRSASHHIARAGLVQVPEGRRVFPAMTVLENLLLGGIHAHADERRGRVDRCYDLFPRLAERKEQAAGSLSGGEQQMLAIGRALMADPQLVMMDEPSLGLAPSLVEATFSTITRIRDEGLGVLLVEQNAGEALEVSDRAYVMETGEIVLSGTAEEVRKDPQVKSAYLGL